MEEKELADIIEFITKHTGIIPRNTHKTGIENYINKRLAELKEENPSFNQTYYSYLEQDPDEMMRLINSATVNETYFFREEGQFNLLKTKILPELRRKKSKLNFWSAAASSGEEIYSLYLLAKSMGIETECTASDINTHVLNICEKGVYKPNAIRAVDGAAYHNLVNKYIQADGSIKLPEDVCNAVIRKQINLSKLEDFPKEQDIVFVRNVFIYFSNEMKKKIISKITDEVLNDNGYLFVSMNEIPSIDSTMIPANLEKLSDGKVYYFHKKKAAN